MKYLAIAVLMILCIRSAAHAYEGRRDNSILLNGIWKFALGDGDEGAEMPGRTCGPLVQDGQAELVWQEVTLPGEFMEWSEDAATTIKFVWARRKFHVSDVQAGSLAVLRWNYISLGAVAFINGQKVGENEPTGPYQVIVKEGILKPGENEIVLRIPGAAGVRKAKSGYFLIPAGFAKGSGPACLCSAWYGAYRGYAASKA